MLDILKDLREVVIDLQILRAADKSRDQHIALMRERIQELLYCNNRLLERARRAEAKLKELHNAQ